MLQLGFQCVGLKPLTLNLKPGFNVLLGSGAFGCEVWTSRIRASDFLKGTIQ